MKLVTNVDPYIVARILRHLSKGIAASHHVGVIHRDLKPSNVMLAGGIDMSAIKITDFGIAKMAEEEIADAVKGGEESITGSMTMVGALPYMAPEMIENPKNAESPADIWALGAMTYELLCGKKPFGVGLKAVPQILSALPPDMPNYITSNIQFSPLATELFDTILKCLEKNPDDRPTSDTLVNMCEKMCYQLTERKLGIIRTIKHDAWGFIACNDGSPDAFFHLASVYGTRPNEGDTVWFSQYPGDPAPRAYPVVFITGS